MTKKYPSTWWLLWLRSLCIIALLYALSFITDLFLPLQQSREKLLARDHQKHKRHYWVTQNFRSPVTEQMYNAFPAGELVEIKHTKLYRTVFAIAYTKSNDSSLKWERSRFYYFVILLPVVIVFSAFIALRNRWNNTIASTAAATALIFSGVLIFISRF